MKQQRQVRIIKRNQQQNAEVSSEGLAAGGSQPSERELKTVVTGWVREHRQRSEEYRQRISELLKRTGFQASRAAKLA